MVVVTIDVLGRLLLPKHIRDLFKTKRFVVNVEKDEIILKPVKTWDELFGSFPGLNTKLLKKMREEDAEYG